MAVNSSDTTCRLRRNIIGRFNSEISLWTKPSSWANASALANSATSGIVSDIDASCHLSVRVPVALPLIARPRFNGLNWVMRTGSRSGNRAMISSSPPMAVM